MKIHLLPSAIAAVSLALTPSALAQLEEVIVTAQKREQSLQDVPMAVTAVGRAFIENNEINTIEDLTKVVPSVRMTPDGSPSGGSIRVRGVGTNVFSSAVEPNVLVMLDGVPLARNSLANFDFADIERIEVLRGPQGTLFGKNASAGLIHVITRDPAPEFEARLKVNTEKNADWPGSLYKLQTTVSGPMTDTIGLRLTGFYKQSEGVYEDINFDSNLPDVKRYGLRSKLRWDPSAELMVRFDLELERTDGETPPVVFRSAHPELAQRLQPIEPSEENRRGKTFGTNRYDTESLASTLALDWELGAVSLSSITAFRSADTSDNISTDGLNGQRVDLTSNGAEQSIDTFTQEFRVTSADSEVLEYTAGVLWFDNRIERDFSRTVDDLPAAFFATVLAPGVPLPAVPAAMLGGSDAFNQREDSFQIVETRNLGVFAEATWHLHERWHLTAGARYIRDEVIVDTLERFSRVAHTATDTELMSSRFGPGGTTVKDTAATGRLSLQYDWGEHSTVYGTVATGYRGSAIDLDASDSQSALDNPVDPETALTYELGLKSRLLDNRLELNVAAFHTTFEDFQAQITDLDSPGSLASFRLDNAGELETKGVEIEFTARPVNPVTLVGSVLYNKAVYREFVTQCFQGQRGDEGGAIDRDGDGTCDAQDVAGKPLANAPQWSASLTSRYDHVYGELGQTLYAQLTGRWQDEVQFSNDQHPLTIHDAYSIWDLRVGWLSSASRFQIAAYVKNLFDEMYVASIVPLSLVNDRRDLVHNVSSDANRSYGVAVEYQW